MELRDPRKQEVIYGVVFDMSPSQGRKHALIDGNIFNQLKNSFKDSRCEIFMEQLDFYFHYQEDQNDYIIPDIAIVCDWGKHEKRYHGTPRFVVETLSPSTGHSNSSLTAVLPADCPDNPNGCLRSTVCSRFRYYRVPERSIPVCLRAER